jgi:hypothetical protein
MRNVKSCEGTQQELYVLLGTQHAHNADNKFSIPENGWAGNWIGAKAIEIQAVSTKVNPVGRRLLHPEPDGPR